MNSVSVIIPNYNHERYLPMRIESVLRQTYQDFELILLDDCSTDDSRSVLLQYAGDARVRLEFNGTNSGNTFKQWNKGVRLARGKYIWIAESDDYADGKLLETLVRALERDQDVAFAYCKSWQVEADGTVTGPGDRQFDELDAQLWVADFVMNGREHCRKYSLRSPVIGNASGAIFRKAAYEAAGGADESLRLCGDWKLWAAMALKGDVAFANARLNYFRYHPQTVRNAAQIDARDVVEKLLVLRWILDQIGGDYADVRNACEEAANHWVPALMSFRISSQAKLTIWRLVKELDPHPAMRLVRPGGLVVQRKVTRHWRSLLLAFAARGTGPRIDPIK